MGAASSRIRLSELIGSLSLATDIGMGQPMDHALRTCWIALGVAREMALSNQDCRDVYLLSLLRFVGCNSHADHDAAMSGGDEISFRGGVAPILSGETSEFISYMIRHLGEELPRTARARLVAGAIAGGSKSARETTTATCEVAQMIAQRLGLGQSVVEALGYTFEYWNGKGMPKGASGEKIPIAARIAIVARDVEVLDRAGGQPVVEEVLKSRRGRAYDPKVTDAFLEHSRHFLDSIDEQSVWDQVMEADPSDSPWLDEAQLHETFRCFADFADIKCWFTRGHSHEVSFLAEAASKALGLNEAEARSISFAGLLQELGRTGIPNGVLAKAGPLTSSQWERIRLTTYLTQRVLDRCSSLEEINLLASSHHERLDGSGYHRGTKGAQVPLGSQILGAADALKAMTSDRPWRIALSRDDAAGELKLLVGEGMLDSRVVDAVLTAAGHDVAPSRVSRPGGLTNRETEILRLIGQGRTNREVAALLVISPKTVGRHVENIYAKIGVSTRPGATLFAMHNGLIP